MRQAKKGRRRKGSAQQVSPRDRRSAAHRAQAPAFAPSMKISISSPDGLGDFVLRIPFFEALCDAGHDLQIFMRPPAFELATALLPNVRVEMLGEDPYTRL